MLIDTHCHIHDKKYSFDQKAVLNRARDAGVTEVICVGTDINDSLDAARFADENEGVFAAVGIHPGESLEYDEKLLEVAKSSRKVVAIGEIGLDYHYDVGTRDEQIKLFEAQLQVAMELGLPVTFHVREAYEDFWAVLDGFREIRGVLHCFSDKIENLKQALDRGLYIGLGGIVTFTKDEEQKKTFNYVPLDRVLFETDAPYLTPKPFRGTMNEPAYVKVIAEQVADSREVSLELLETVTTRNAENLFKI